MNTLKSVVDCLDRRCPVIRFGMPWPKFPFPTRMTVIRLASEDLFVHSPTPLTPPLREDIERAGRVRFIVGPNRIHYWWIPEWKSAFPDAAVYLAPRIKEQARGRIIFQGIPLVAANGYPWDAEIATLPIPGSYMPEIEFFHRTSPHAYSHRPDRELRARKSGLVLPAFADVDRRRLTAARWSTA